MHGGGEKPFAPRRSAEGIPVQRMLPRLAMVGLVLATGVTAAAPRAYVPNEGSATVSVIDTATDRVVDTLKIGQKPRGIAIGRDGRLYVSDQPTGAVIVYDVER